MFLYIENYGRRIGLHCVIQNVDLMQNGIKRKLNGGYWYNMSKYLLWNRGGNGLYKYDAALSYESESYDFVKKIANYLDSDGWKIFFAPDKKQELLSENLNSKLYQIYQNESLVKVLFVTEKYLHSQYTMLEARRSLSSARNNERRLIVVNFIEEKLPDELKPFVYMEGDMAEDDIAFLVSDRIAELKKDDHHDEQEKCRKEVKIEINNLNFSKNNKGIQSGDSANLNHIYLR